MARPGYKRLLVVPVTSSRTEESVKSAALGLLNRYEERSNFTGTYFADVLDLKHQKLWFASGREFAIDYAGTTEQLYILKNDFPDYIGKSNTQALIAIAKAEAVQEAIDEIGNPGLF